MNAVRAKARWSPARWWTTIGALFVLQAGLIAWFSPRAPRHVIPPTDSPRILLAPARIATRPGAISPMDFGPVTRGGFSGPLWLQSPAIARPLEEWKEPPNWLALDGTGLGESFADLVQRARPAPVRVRPPMQETAFPGIAHAPPPVAPLSHLVIEGDLLSRAPMQLPSLPDWTNKVLLEPTALEVGVNADGRVHSVVLSPRRDVTEGRASTMNLATSGRMDVDQFAVQTVRSLAFRPLTKLESATASVPLTWGRLVFHWRTIPANESNASAGPP